VSASHLEWAFGAVLLVFAVAVLGLRRARTRRELALAAAAPLAAFVAYEAWVGRVMPAADVRLDWMLLFPIAIVHVAHAATRWRRIGERAVD
jgi:hypothetical protein